jgi:hypothetical protein
MHKTPEKMREELLASLDRPIIQALDSEGITDDLLARKLKEELEAKETKTFQYKGDVIESKEKIAWDVRQRARQDAHKLRGDYPSEKHHHTFDAGVPIVPLTEDQQLELEAIKELKKREKMKEGLMRKRDFNTFDIMANPLPSRVCW